MATGDDTQNLLTHQHCKALTNDIESRLTLVINRIKFLLDLLGYQPDNTFTCHTNHLEAELVSLLNELEGIKGLQQQHTTVAAPAG